ncbi:DUF4037 domain-containing protein [Bifidobacterium aesculapii]|uniref:DUF4037 domain-containing protein n=1 Tax=Bifidobacterium aesculapii TaxID=1329411 RepID=UPI0035201C23
MEAALEGMIAKHAHDFEDTDPTGTSDTRGTIHDPNAPTFDVNQFLAGLDAIFDAHDAATKAGPYLQQAAIDAENAGDEAGLLTVLNETMGFYRSQGLHKENQWIVQRAIELALHMGLEGSEAWATTLINCATAMRAAKHYDQSEDLYQQALACAERTFDPKDRRLAALHNNLSMLYSETNRTPKAEQELREALRIMESSSVNPDEDIDVASSHTNLALVLLEEGKLEGADWHAEKALEIYAAGHLEHSAHFASALAGLAQVRYAEHRYGDAAAHYRRALAVIEECYGRNTDYYRVTAANLAEAERKAGDDTTVRASSDASTPSSSSDATAPSDHSATGEAATDRGIAGTAPRTHAAGDAAPAHTLSGLKLAKAYWEEVGRPMIEAKYPEYVGRIAVGLVGHGSECYGFDDGYSHDHDFGPRFCLWLTDEDYAAIGARLQADYDALPRDFRGFVRPSADADEPTTHIATGSASNVASGVSAVAPHGTSSVSHDVSRNGKTVSRNVSREDGDANAAVKADADGDTASDTAASPLTPRAQGAFRRDGVFRIGDFFESLTGYRKAPAQDAPHEWMMLDEATLATATNGQVFADPLGAFSKTRQGFKDMPEDVRLALISKRLGMIAQAGQYNLPRSLKRGDAAAAWLSISEFANAASSLVFLINKPMIAGYAPYYKWRFAALRKLSGGMFARLGDVCGELETVMRLASAACYGGAGFGEGGKGSAPAADAIERAVEHVAASVVKELAREGLTRSDETFLEWQRPYVEEHIVSSAPCLHSL